MAYLASIAVVVFFAGNILVGSALTELPPVTIALIRLVVALVILLPVVGVEWLLLGAPALGAPDLWAGLIYLGVFPSVVAILCYNYAVSRIGAAQASLFLNFLPVFTIAGSYVFLGDEVTGAQILGALVVICGVVLATYTGSRRPSTG